MPDYIRKALTACRLLTRGGGRELASLLRRQAWSEGLAYGLCRDLVVPVEPPSPRIALRIRPLRPGDIPLLLGGPESDPEQSCRKLLLDAGIPTAWVAATGEDIPCYVQWLFSPAEDRAIGRYFDGLFPPLASDEGLLEYAYTPNPFRRNGIMPWAMARIAEEARAFGARRVITFTGVENHPSLKGCRAAGFKPYCLRRESWRLFRHRVTFSPIAPDSILLTRPGAVAP
jgi:hypothetical protein